MAGGLIRICLVSPGEHGLVEGTTLLIGRRICGHIDPNILACRISDLCFPYDSIKNASLTHGCSRAFLPMLESYNHVVVTRFLINSTPYGESFTHAIFHCPVSSFELNSLQESLTACCTLNVAVQLNELHT
jgi:hypothetical protein